MKVVRFAAFSELPESYFKNVAYLKTPFQTVISEFSKLRGFENTIDPTIDSTPNDWGRKKIIGNYYGKEIRADDSLGENVVEIYFQEE